jgi:hypothetical protein
VIRIHFYHLDTKSVSIGLAAALRVGGLNGVTGDPGPEYSKFDELNEKVAQSFEAVGLDQAEVVVYPHRAVSGPEIVEVANEARRRNLGCVFFSWGDVDEPVSVPYGTVYRHSLFADQRLENEQAMPAEISDPQSEMGFKIYPREKSDAPSVGFCGFVSNPVMRTTYRLMGRHRKAKGLIIRARALRALKRVRGLQTKFISRQSFWAGARGRFHRSAAAEYKPRAAFWDNVMNNDYTLCVRGAGNYSYRFYEVLAAGRIPLFINTGCVLPFEDEIDWKRHCVWVEEDQIDSAGEILMDFHSRLSPRQFRARQLANRTLWESKLSPLAFYQNALSREVPGTAAPIPLPDWERPEVAPAAAS